MKLLRGILVGLVAGGIQVSAALASGVAPTPTALDGTAILPDPSLAKAHVVPVSAVTAGTAVVSAASDGPLHDCSRKNPCALATPARDTVVVGGTHSAAISARPAEHDARVVKPRRGAGDLKS